MMVTLFSLAASLEDVFMTIYIGANEDKVGIELILGFQWVDPIKYTHGFVVLRFGVIYS